MIMIKCSSQVMIVTMAKREKCLTKARLSIPSQRMKRTNSVSRKIQEIRSKSKIFKIYLKLPEALRTEEIQRKWTR